MLTTYLTLTTRLLQNPSAPVALYSNADLTTFINKARGQVAAEGECIRKQATVSTVAATQAYNFSGLNTGVSATNGIAGAIHIRSILYGVGSGQGWLEPRPWQWFSFFYLNDPIPNTGAPTNWAQYAQGANGSFYVAPVPDAVYVLTCDCVCYPIDLVNNATVEALPFLWTDAVPFLAAYYALLGGQANARIADAERMFGYYQVYMQRARQAANPSVQRGIYEQAEDPTKISKLGLQKAAQQ